MPEPIIHQLSAFALFIMGGILLGLAFDLLAAFRLLLHPRGLSSLSLDLLYWLTALGLIFPLLLLGTRGEPRLFFWLALAAGLAYYSQFLHSFGRGLSHRLAQLILISLRIIRRFLCGTRFLRVEPGLSRHRLPRLASFRKKR
ncbi:MAG: hypothetical protein EHM21_12730 [Chloroflexi bacterium]|nr:MAG: hypothetical protein EHM21_12730 [Chloroflexota bacterium]